VPGYAFKSSDWRTAGIPVVKIKNITGSNSVDLATTDCVPESLLTPKLQKFVINDGDILVAMTGATAGKVGRVRTSRQLLLNQRVAKIAPVEADPDFIWAVVSSQEYQEKFFYLADGAAQPNMSGGQIEGVEIPLPPLPVQQRIAGILSAYDELIENSQRRIKILESMARALYREWFVHFRFPGHENHPRVASPLGEIPQGWEAIAFTEIADVLSGGTPKTSTPEYWDGEIPFFTPRDAPDCFYVEDADKHVTELGLSKCASQLYPPDTVFITARGTVGKVALPSVPMAMNQSCYALRGKLGISQRFLFLITLQQVEYLKTNTGGATFDTIVVDTFRRMQVAKPPHDLIAAFTHRVDAVFDQVNTLQRQIQNLRRTRDLLLPRLLSGQIEVETA
jgi:type I restriction enzyme S subunit